MICKECRDTMGVWRRLKGYDHEGKPLDDGKLHLTLCMSTVCRMLRGWK